MHHDNTDANGWAYRNGGGHVGESMPGTVGTPNGLRSQQGQTPVVDDGSRFQEPETDVRTESVDTGGVEGY